MALRLIEIYHEKGMAKEIDFLLKDAPVIDMWHDLLPEGETITKVLLRSKNTEGVLDILQGFFSTDKKLRVVIMPVEATILRPDEEEEEADGETARLLAAEKAPILNLIHIDDISFADDEAVLT